jgi:hypothetical protein
MTRRFQPLSAEQLRERYGSFWRPCKKPLDPKNVPEALRVLVPYAELWGVSDDTDRDQLVEASPPLARDDLTGMIDVYNDLMDTWLAGPEADGPKFSREYIAFSNMRIAYDYLSVL